MEEKFRQYLSVQDKASGRSIEELGGELELDTTNLGAGETEGIVAESCIDALMRQG